MPNITFHEILHKSFQCNGCKLKLDSQENMDSHVISTGHLSYTDKR